MKRVSYILILGLVSISVPSCSDLLDVESRTQITTNYIYSTPEGLSRAIVGLYQLDRSVARKDGGSATCYASWLLDAVSDLTIWRGGSPDHIFKLSASYTPDYAVISDWWTHYYNVIGKANEIIASAEQLGLEHPEVAAAWAEAKVFRARCHLELYKKWERILLSKEPTTADNYDKQTYRPASKQEVFTLIYDDLQEAIDSGGLEWTVPAKSTGTTPEYGRFTIAVAKHIKAEAALWMEDWDEAIEQCEDIFERPEYDLYPNTIDCFTGANLNQLDGVGYTENLLVQQFSESVAGGGAISGGAVAGHRMSAIGTPALKNVIGENLVEYGGFGWGRGYPNTYLLSLYDKEKDVRYNTLFKHTWTFPEGHAKAGQTIKVPEDVSHQNYLRDLHFQSLKYFDQWTNTNNPDRTTGFKDIVLYRLAETYLIAAEAYMRRDGGTSSDALRCYNKVWMRSGNDRFDGPLTQQVLQDEYARELHWEGRRFALLRRYGTLVEQVKAHAGDSKAEDPNLDKDYTDARKNVRDYHVRWPIPESEINMMGKENFPQNPDWEL